MYITSISNISLASEIQLYPNPTSGQITLELENVQSELSLQMFNSMGQEIHRQMIQEYNAKLDIDISQHSNGVYFIQLTSKDGDKQYIKIIKQ